MLTFRILLKSGDLQQNEVDQLIIGKVDPQPPPMPDVLKSFLNETIWAGCKELEKLPTFGNLTQSLDTDQLQWKKWYQDEKAEVADLPKAFKDISKFHKLLILRTMRPDRVTSALSNFVTDRMGEKYIEQSPFNIFEAFEESSKSVPMFFVLFPGVDPTPDVEKVAAKYQITSLNRRFINISMDRDRKNQPRRPSSSAPSAATGSCSKMSTSCNPGSTDSQVWRDSLRPSSMTPQLTRTSEFSSPPNHPHSQTCRSFRSPFSRAP